MVAVLERDEVAQEKYVAIDENVGGIDDDEVRFWCSAYIEMAAETVDEEWYALPCGAVGRHPRKSSLTALGPRRNCEESVSP